MIFDGASLALRWKQRSHETGSCDKPRQRLGYYGVSVDCGEKGVELAHQAQVLASPTACECLSLTFYMFSHPPDVRGRNMLGEIGCHGPFYKGARGIGLRDLVFGRLGDACASMGLDDDDAALGHQLQRLTYDGAAHAKDRSEFFFAKARSGCQTASGNRLEDEFDDTCRADGGGQCAIGCDVGDHSVANTMPSFTTLYWLQNVRIVDNMPILSAMKWED